MVIAAQREDARGDRWLFLDHQPGNDDVDGDAEDEDEVVDDDDTKRRRMRMRMRMGMRMRRISIENK